VKFFVLCLEKKIPHHLHNISTNHSSLLRILPISTFKDAFAPAAKRRRATHCCCWV